LAILPPGGTALMIPLKLCRLNQPRHPASFCSMPLYGLDRLRQEVPRALEDWLDYHLHHAGFGHAEIYDLDGSLLRALGKQRLHDMVRRRLLSYHSHWGENLSVSMGTLSRRHPCCAETWAYLHCLTTHRATSRWVLLLHSIDEYVVPRWRHEERGFLKVVAAYERGLPREQPVSVSMFHIRASSFARGLAQLNLVDVGASESESGRVVAQSRFRGESYYFHSPMLDPMLCACSGPHTCFAESGSKFPQLAMEFEPRDVAVNHYVEMLDRDVGRCAQQHTSCSVPDASADHIVDLLRARAVAGNQSDLCSKS